MKFVRSLGAAGPFLGGILVYGVYRLFYIEAGVDNLGERFPATALSLVGSGPADTAARELSLLSWSVTGTFFVLAFIGATVVLGRIINDALHSDGYRARRPTIAAVVLLGILVGGLTLADNPFAVDSFNPMLVEAFALLGITEAGLLLALFTPMMLIVVVLLMAATAAALHGEPRPGESPGLHLRNQTRCINTALFAGAIILVAGIVHAGAVHRLPGVLLPEPVAPSWEELIHGLSASTGAVWTFILLGIYLPALAVLRTRARALAFDAVDEKTPEKIDGWLASHGLAAHFPQKLARIGALLSPLLIGGPASPLIGIFGN